MFAKQFRKDAGKYDCVSTIFFVIVFFMAKRDDFELCSLECTKSQSLSDKVTL